MRGHAVGAQIGMMQVAAHESLCGHKPRRARATAARHGGRVARGAERQCRQVVEVHDHQLGQFRRRIRRQVVESADVAFEQGDRLVVARHRADEPVLEIADQSRDLPRERLSASTRDADGKSNVPTSAFDIATACPASTSISRPSCRASPAVDDNRNVRPSLPSLMSSRVRPTRSGEILTEAMPKSGSLRIVRSTSNDRSDSGSCSSRRNLRLYISRH